MLDLVERSPLVGLGSKRADAHFRHGIAPGAVEFQLVLGKALCKFRSQSGRAVGKDSRDVIRELEADGWRFVGASGSHHHFKHPTKPGKVTIPHPRRDLHPKTVRSIYRQAGLKEPR